MHIEPGIVTGAKLLLSYGTAAAAGTYILKLGWENLKQGGIGLPLARTGLAAAAAFTFFQVLPHFQAGVSEVHFILGSTLFLLFGAAPAGFGLALGLLLQGVLFAPLDLPQYGMNLTTLLVPLFALQALARRIIAPRNAFADLGYGQALALSAAYQGGVVAWVGFWAVYGQGFDASTLAAVGTFGAAYMTVVLIEPLIDLMVLAWAKSLRGAAVAGLLAPGVVCAPNEARRRA